MASKRRAFLNLVIRSIYPSEWEEYKTLRLRALKLVPQAYNSGYKEELLYTDSEWKKRITDPSRILIFAQDKKKFVGMIGALINWHDEGEDTARLISFYVDKRYRKNSIGKKLLHEILTVLEERKDIRRVRLGVAETQKEAMHIYKLFGFYEIGKQVNKLGLEVTTMEKLLS